MRAHTLFAPAFPLLLAAAASAQTDISGPIWDGNGGPLLSGTVYHAVGTLSVPAGQTLTVQPGAIVKFGADLSFDVSGTLAAGGTSGSPVIFTDLRDDAAGGDTNGDGASSGTPGWWRQIKFAAGSDASAMQWAEVRYAGRHSWDSILIQGASPSLDRCTVRDGLASAIGLNNTSISPSITNCDLSNCGGYAVDDVHVDAVPGISDNTASGNSSGDYLRITEGTPTVDLTLTQESCLGGALVVGDQLTVPLGLTLTLEEGVVLKFPNHSAYIDVAGTLVTRGTPAEPVAITALADDDHGGDTDGGGPSSGSPGTFTSLIFRSTAGASDLEHTVVRYSGRGGWSGIIVQGAGIRLFGVTLADCPAYGLDFQSMAAFPIVEHCRFENMAYYPVFRVPLEAVPGFADNQATGNGWGDALHVEPASMSADVTLTAESCLAGAILIGSNEPLTVPAGLTLALEPGVVLKFLPNNNWIDVFGSLVVRGAQDDPVVLTDYADDDYGGDTNGNGPSSGSPGQWKGIYFRPSGGASAMVHTVLRYAGRGSSSTVALEDADVLLQDCTIADGYGDGLDLQGTAARPTVERCESLRNNYYAVDGVTLDAVPGFSWNRASDNNFGDFALVVDASPTTDLVLRRRNGVNGAIVIDDWGVVPAGTRLAFEPGTVVKFKYSSNSGWDVQGSLDVMGTGLDPVVFTCSRDDEHSGDTNGDGPSSGAAGDWRGIRFNAGAEPSDVRHLLVRYAGRSGWASLTLDSPQVAVRSTRVDYTAGTAFLVRELAGDAVNWVVHDSAVGGIRAEGGSFDILHATVHDVQAGQAGILKTGSYGGEVWNSISWGPTPSMNFSGFATGELHYCDGSPSHAGSDGNVYEDPLFADTAGGDLRLSATSPCIDTADHGTGVTVATDIDERSRLLDPELTGTLMPDMGAYEADLWWMDVRGQPISGAWLRCRVTGPAGTSTYLMGFLDGSTLDDPFGVIAAGDLTLTTLGSAAVGQDFRVPVPIDAALVGSWFGVQTRTVPTGDPSVGAITNLYRGLIRLPDDWRAEAR